MNKISQLPSELLSSILKYIEDDDDLFACTLVNKSFYNEIIRLNWQCITLYMHIYVDRFIVALNTFHSSPGIYIRQLKMGTMLSDAELLAVNPHMPLLQDLQLTSAHRISDTSFQQLPAHCPHLTSLWIKGSFSMTHVSMLAIAQHCHQLTTLELEHCDNVDAPWFAALLPTTTMAAAAAAP